MITKQQNKNSFKIDKDYFLEKGEFAFDNFPSEVVFDIFLQIEIIQNKINGKEWEQLQKKDIKKAFNYRIFQQPQELIKQFIMNDEEQTYFDKETKKSLEMTTEQELKIHKIKIKDKGRLLFHIIDGVLFPIGYDRYHFLDSENTVSNKVSFLIYKKFKNFISKKFLHAEIKKNINKKYTNTKQQRAQMQKTILKAIDSYKKSINLDNAEIVKDLFEEIKNLTK
ncbi:hypothetical protein [Candidatus Phytoplasma pruni]|uniref:Uncharacterized protein n=1 Tax=Candidatus Phytoplasma pruni TaxID=479893 RepID=A0A851HH16_9MOLU|nr:hypothetical protein [Candidatus Phytoplasma pruni]NWN45910.1 hypothetical protein [Candidatus Phytoplasma pruni]